MSRILVIADDDIVRAILANVLSSAQYEVRLATDNESGLRTHHESPVDVVLTSDIPSHDPEGLKRALEGFGAVPIGLIGNDYENGTYPVLRPPLRRDEVLRVVERLKGSPT